MLKCVPLDPAWTGSETKLDLKAIYRRRKQDNWGTPILDADGFEQWDITTPLPLRRHNAWMSKGFQYITLADQDSLIQIAQALPDDWRSYIQNPRTRSPFSLDLYLAGVQQQKADQLAAIRALVADFGLEMVTRMKQAEQPGWVMPKAVADEFADDTDPVKPKRGRPAKDAVPA